jgi:hypothetical protein
MIKEEIASSLHSSQWQESDSDAGKAGRFYRRLIALADNPRLKKMWEFGSVV